MKGIYEDFTVLVVDDDPETRNLLVELLEDSYRAEGAESINRAIEVVRRNPRQYDIALVDLVLPEEVTSDPMQDGGFEATRQLLRINPDMKIVIFTGKGDQGGLEQLKKGAKEARAYRLIVKDSLDEIEELIEVVRQLNDIQAQIEETVNNRQWASGLLESLEVGLSIVDEECRLWYLDETSQKLRGELPSESFCWLNHHHKPNQTRDPCGECPVYESFHQKKQADPRFVISNTPAGIRYLQEYVTPLQNSKDMPIAALIATQDASESPVVENLPTREKLRLVLNGIRSWGYDSIRVYRFDSNAQTLEGICQVGGDSSQNFEKQLIDVPKDAYTRQTLIETKAPKRFNCGEYGTTGCSEILQRENVTQWLQFPLLTPEGEILGLLSVDNRESQSPLQNSDLRIIQDFADEAAKILLREHLTYTRQKVDAQLETILQSVQERGYKRLRLYEASYDKKRLIGRVQVGDGLNMERFSDFSIYINDDPVTYYTCTVKREPYLFDKKNPDQIEIGEEPFTHELGKDGVERWIEYPLIDPNKGLVGHLCLDNKGKKEGNLTEDDFGIILLYAKQLTEILVAEPAKRPEPAPLISGLDTIIRGLDDTIGANLALTGKLDQGLKIILERIQSALLKGVSSGCVLVLHDKTLRVGAAVGGLGQLFKLFFIKIAETIHSLLQSTPVNPQLSRNSNPILLCVPISIKPRYRGRLLRN